MQVVPQAADDKGAEYTDFKQRVSKDHHKKDSSRIFRAGRKQKRPPGNIHIAAKVSLISWADGNASRVPNATCC
jgi:hypothetical protein